MRICPKSGQIFWEPEHIVLWSSDGGEIHSSAASSPCKSPTTHEWEKKKNNGWRMFFDEPSAKKLHFALNQPSGSGLS